MKYLCLLALGFLSSTIATAKVADTGFTHPMVFVENKGQIKDQNGKQRPDVQFRLQSPAVNMFIGSGQLHYQWNKTAPLPGTPAMPLSSRLLQKDRNVESYRMDVTLVGANTHAAVTTSEQQDYSENYYSKQSAANGLHAASYKKIIYKDIYPKIDWVLYVKNDAGSEKVEYDFIVHPGGKVSDIKLQYGGASSLKVNGDGSLTATTPMGSVTEQKPSSYSVPADGMEPTTTVASSFNLQNNTLSFNAASYSGTLVIDPSLEWGTYLGGFGFDLCNAVATDAANKVYIAGSSFFSANIVTTGAYQTMNAGDFDGFLAKFNSNGSISWATYYGGIGDDNISGLAIDAAGKVYISGITNSDSAMATTGSFQDTISSAYFDLFLVKFDSAGNRIWGTYYGGNDVETGGLCATDNQGHVYLAGHTLSASGIAFNGFQNAFNGSVNNAFLVQFDTAGVRHWATYYGDTTESLEGGVACDLSGNVYLAGQTSSHGGLSTTGTYQPAAGGGKDNFIVKFNAAGARQWATYYGGPGDELTGGYAAIACDQWGNIVLNGRTNSTSGIASTGAFQTTLAGAQDAFLVEFDSTGARKWGTYYGGTSDENGQAVAFDLSGNIFLDGITLSNSGIASPGAYQPAYGGGSDDAFIVKMDTAGNRVWGTYYGGAAFDEAYAIGFDKLGSLYVAGSTGSNTNIVTPNGYDTTYNGGIAIFLGKFCLADIPTNDTVSGADTICAHATQVYSIDSVAGAGATAYIWSFPTGWTATGNGKTISVTAGTTSGLVSVKVVKCNDTSTARTLHVYVRPEVPAIITVNGFQLGTVNTHNAYQWYLNGVLIPGATNATYDVTQNGDYTVKVVNPGGCTDSSSAYTVTNVSVTEIGAIGRAIIVYPNPAASLVHILSPVPVNITITSMDGKEVLHQQNAGDVNIGQLADGIYMLHFTDQNNTSIKTEKLVKMKQ